jgi:chemotaxis protein methyltransferase CheR
MKARDLLALRMAEWTGLDLERGGRADALDRLIEQRTKKLRYPTADAYVASLSSPGHPEVVWLVNVITVGHTWFFRDREQTAAISALLRAAPPAGERLQVWAAGCSTGEEAYTVAMLAGSTATPVDILATDINSEAIERARLGEYSQWSTRDVPRELMWMLPSIGGGRMRVDDSVRRLVRFERHNLMNPPPKPRHGAAWHMVLCRNVIIYFRRSEVVTVTKRLASAVAPGGWLLLGAGEILESSPAGFAIVQVGTRYVLQRKDAAVLPAQRMLSPPSTGPMGPTGPFTVARPIPRLDDLLERALACLESGASSEAIMACAEALQLEPLSPQAHLVSGIAFHMNDDPGAAARALRSALLLEPDEWLASFYLALTYDRLGREDDAQREYRHVEAASQQPRPRSRLRVLEAYRDEIVMLARARGRRGFAR